MTDVISPETHAPSTAQPRPGWPEIAVAAAAFVACLGLTIIAAGLVPDERPVQLGLVAVALSILLGLGPFAAAYFLRIRDLAVFGVRRVPRRWLGIGVAAGLACFMANIVVGVLYRTVTGDETNAQEGLQTATGSSIPVLLLMLLLGAVATPVAEELLWRGVLANALARYGLWISVIASSALFALAHGVNNVLPGAFVIGAVCALLLHRSGSIWPAVIVHLVNNFLALSIVGLVELTA
ncbi:putative abortive infection protein [Kineosporia sp. NBRC 101677]|nr:putative abortive infection protein [Kineosporia sp. NBRC 101677]